MKHLEKDHLDVYSYFNAKNLPYYVTNTVFGLVCFKSNKEPSCRNTKYACWFLLPSFRRTCVHRFSFQVHRTAKQRRGVPRRNAQPTRLIIDEIFIFYYFVGIEQRAAFLLDLEALDSPMLDDGFLFSVSRFHQKTLAHLSSLTCSEDESSVHLSRVY